MSERIGRTFQGRRGATRGIAAEGASDFSEEHAILAVDDETLRADITRQGLCRTTRVIVVDRAVKLRQSLACGAEAGIILLGLKHSSGLRTTDSLSEIRGHDAAVPVLLCRRPDDQSVRSLAAFARAGADGVLIVSTAVSLDSQARIVEERLRHRLSGAVVHASMTPEPSHACAIAGWCIRNAYRPMSSARLRDWFGEDSSTLNRTLKRARRGTLRDNILLARLLHVAWWLDESGLPLERIATLLRFPTPSALRMLLYRLGESASSLRERGAVASIHLMYQDRIGAP